MAPDQDQAADPLPRIWDDPVGTGDPVPFDPNLHEPPLSAEELEELEQGEP